MQLLRNYLSIFRTLIGRRHGSYILRKKTLSYFRHVDTKTTLEGEYEYRRRWDGLILPANQKFYRLYSRLSGIKSINYVPEDIYRKVILSILNNTMLHKAYSDKNSYKKLYQIHDINLPYTFIRNMHGTYYDHDYQPLMMNDNLLVSLLSHEKKIIIKPSLKSGGGKKIEIFKKTGNGFVNDRKIKLNLSYLNKNFTKDFLIQKYIKQ